MNEIRPIERVAYVVGTLLVLSGLVHTIVLVASGGSWTERRRVRLVWVAIGAVAFREAVRARSRAL